MIKGKQKIILFDVIYTAFILALLIDLFQSGTVNIGYDAVILTLSLTTAMLIVLMILKEQQFFKNRIFHSDFLKKLFR